MTSILAMSVIKPTHVRLFERRAEELAGLVEAAGRLGNEVNSYRIQNKNSKHIVILARRLLF
jgi:hypothetical protein